MQLVSDPELGRLRTELHELVNDKLFRNSFRRLTALMYDIAKYKGWHSPSKTFTEECMLMVTELAEVVEEYRKPDKEIHDIYYVSQGDYTFTNEDGSTLIIGQSPKPEGVPVEFADLFIRLLDTMGNHNIDLFDVVFEKARFNLNRPMRHGGKRV